jgi:hypothetical protein
MKIKSRRPDRSQPKPLFVALSKFSTTTFGVPVRKLLPEAVDKQKAAGYIKTANQLAPKKKSRKQ